MLVVTLVQVALAVVQETAVVAPAAVVEVAATVTLDRADMVVTAAALTYLVKGQAEVRQA